MRNVSWVTILAIGVLAFASPALADMAEDKAVQLVEKLGGKVERDDIAPGKPVVTVNLRGAKLSDGVLKELAALKNLRELDLMGTTVTGEGLKELAPLKHLQDLYLPQPAVTDRALQCLRHAGLLHAMSTATTRVDRDRPKTPDQITHLNLAATNVTDAVVEYLTPLKNLQWLDLSFCNRVGDPGLKSLAALPKLGGLNLNKTSVSDAGLKHLASVKTLGEVQLHDTNVTDAGVRELQKALPKCKIRR